MARSISALVKPALLVWARERAYRDRTILEVFYATGIRKQELLNLRVRQPGRRTFAHRPGKGGHDRIVPLSRVACRFLESYPNAIRSELLPGKQSDWRFVAARGKPFNENVLSGLVTHYAPPKKTKVKKHITCHSWRHTCATPRSKTGRTCAACRRSSATVRWRPPNGTCPDHHRPQGSAPEISPTGTNGGMLKARLTLCMVDPLSATEILDELPKLTPTELQRIHERILEIEEAQEIEETPELLAAIDEGVRSLESEPTYTLEEVRAKIAQWTSKSS